MIFKSISIFLLLSCLPVLSQNIIEGMISDEKTSKPLAAANIQIEGTFDGTISNADGRFVLKVDQLPATIIVTYIGYESQKITIMEEPSRLIRVKLKPIILEMEPIIVSAEDPAMAIMRKVIKKKQEWRSTFETFIANAYSRLIFENDSGIVSIAESLSDIFWDRERGSREVIKSKRQTSNLSESQNIAVASFIPNFYDDDIKIIGFNIIGPTHPDALDYYKFKLIGERKLDDQIVYDIQVIPDSKLQPTFEGHLAVLDGAFAVLDVDLKPGESIRFPVPIQELNLHYQQQFRSYADQYWLPVDFRVHGDIKIGITGLQFPKIKYTRITALSKYKVNVALPDSLYEEEKILSVDSLSLAQDTLFNTTKVSVPLTAEEENAYDSLDSTMTLEKAFKPTGFLANIIEVTAGDSREDTTGGKDIFSYLAPQIWFNRVDGLHAGLTLKFDISEPIRIRFGGAYKSSLKKWGYHADMEFEFGSEDEWHSQIHYFAGTDSRYPSETYSLSIASFPPLFGREDYFDYYWREGIAINFGIDISKINTDISIEFKSENHTSLAKTTDYNILGTNFKQRDNPDIDTGTMRSLSLSIQYGLDYIPFGVVGQKRAALNIEISHPDILSGDFSFAKYTLSFDWQFRTFLTRRLLPNALDIHLSAGYSTGDLPLQRFGIVDGSFQAFTPYATILSRSQRPYEGEHFFAFFWEHNFRTVPFELINFSFAVDNGIGIIIFGSHGRSWISNKRLADLTFSPAYIDKFHHEFGLSINGIFSLIRFDTAYRLDNQSVYAGISFTRFF